MVGGFGEDGFDAGFENVASVLAGNDDGNGGLLRGDGVADAPVDAGDADEFGFDLLALEVLGEGSALGVVGVVFGGDVEGGGGFDGAPVVEDFGDVDDLLGRAGFDDAESEVPVLGAFEAGSEAACDFEGVAAVDAEVADHVAAEEEVVVPVGLEVGAVAEAVGVDFVLVGIDEFGVGVAGDGFGDAGEGVGGEFVVVVEEGEVVAGGELGGGVGGVGDVAVGFAEGEADAGVLGAVGFEDGGDMGGGGGVVGDAEFPVLVYLADDGIDAVA